MTPPVVSIAFGEDFLSAIVALPAAIQKKVTTMIRKFRQAPDTGGLNYERIEARDARVRSVRVDQGYRAILLAPEKGATYTFVYVDAHDEAYRWAKNRTWSVNPATGGIQVVEIPEAKVAPVEATVASGGPPHPGLFSGLSEEEAARFGVNVVLWPHVQGFATRGEFEAAGNWFPKDVHENLWFLLEGFGVEEILARPERQAVESAATVDVADFETALKAPASSAAFHIVEDDRDLEEILAAPLAKWRIFLHPSQTRIVRRDLAGPGRVLGGPGTGKTVVALHRVRELVRRFFSGENQRVLLTTFTSNLARDLEDNLVALCGEERRRIDVRHVDSVVMGVLRAAGKAPVIPDQEEEFERHWTAALGVAPLAGFDAAFLRDEYRLVVQAQGCTREADYLGASRAGRKRPLARSERRAVWATIQAFRTEGARAAHCMWNDPADAAAALLESGKAPRAWVAAVVDETQDLSAAKLRFLRALIPPGRNDLLLTGDSHQRIYGRAVPLTRVGIDIRGRGSPLTLNYRTTKEIAAFALGLLHGTTADDLDGGQDHLRGYRSIRSGPQAQIRVLSTEADEDLYLVSSLRSLLSSGLAPEDILLTCRTSALTRRFSSLCSSSGIPTLNLSAPAPDSPPPSAIRVATMHRDKGLEFRAVIIAGLRDTVLPNPKAREDSESESSWHARERLLLFVASTRARDSLLLTASSPASPFLLPPAS